MNGTTDLNFNATECIARTNDIGGALVRNVCSGAQTYVAWGSADWALAIVVSVIIACFVGILGAMAFALVTGRF